MHGLYLEPSYNSRPDRFWTVLLKIMRLIENKKLLWGLCGSVPVCVGVCVWGGVYLCKWGGVPRCNMMCFYHISRGECKNFSTKLKCKITRFPKKKSQVHIHGVHWSSPILGLCPSLPLLHPCSSSADSPHWETFYIPVKIESNTIHSSILQTYVCKFTEFKIVLGVMGLLGPIPPAVGRSQCNTSWTGCQFV